MAFGWLNRSWSDGSNDATGEDPCEPCRSANDVQADLRMTLAEDVLESLSIRITVLDSNGTVIWKNALADQADYQHEHWPKGFPRIGTSYLAAYRIAVSQGDRNAMRALAGILAVLHGRTPRYRLDYPCYRPHGLLWFALEVMPLASGRGVVITHENVTERKREAHELVCRRALLSRSGYIDTEQPAATEPAAGNPADSALPPTLKTAAKVFTNSGEAMLITDANRRIQLVNNAFCAATGYPLSETIGRALSAFFAENREAPGACETVWRALDVERHWQGEVWGRLKKGGYYPVLLTIDAVCDEQGRLQHYVVTATDITALKEVHERLHFLAHHDPLTGLANRLLFGARLEQAIEHARRHNHCVGLLFADIDEFKSINDSLGHSVGDRLLECIAARLRDQLRGIDTIARLGGDEFGVILEEVRESRDAVMIAEKLARLISEPVACGSSSVTARASIGIGLYPFDGNNSDLLYQAADRAMYLAKASSTGKIRLFGDSEDTRRHA